MKIANIGYNYRHSPEFSINRPYGSGDNLLLIIKTQAFIWLGGERIIVSPNSAVIFKRGTPQIYGVVDGEYVNDWIHFDLDASEEAFFSTLGIPFDTVISLNDSTELLGFIKNIFFELYSQNRHKEATMKRYFELLLLKLSEGLCQEGTMREHPYYKAFCMLHNEIRRDPQHRWSIDEISSKMNLSRSYVQHLYKRFFQISILSDIKKSRIEHAKYLLSATDETVCSIAQTCGYDNDVHFMRTFKKETNMTPSQFREKFRISPTEIAQSNQRPPFSFN